MVQSATDYQFTLTVNDIFDNTGTYEGIISVDVLVRREGDILRIIVPSIVFPPNSANFALLSDEDMRPNRRVLRLIANALNKFADYQITVEGHANPTTAPGTAERTTEEAGTRTVIGLVPLSNDRAKAVVEYLATNHEVNRTRLSTVGIGGERTVAAWDDDDENWKNRRVEFILKK
jgi:outer membrane protein OmpA-like peptidoglycan-associated protein